MSNVYHPYHYAEARKAKEDEDERLHKAEEARKKKVRKALRGGKASESDSDSDY